MKLNISAEWLTSSDATPEPSGYVTPRDRAELTLRREAAQLNVPTVTRKTRSRKSTVKVAAAK